MTPSGLAVVVAALVASCAAVLAQDHAHTAPASGIAHGVPRLCAGANITSVANGPWSSATIWSTGKVPAAGDGVLITAGMHVGGFVCAGEDATQENRR